MAGKGPLERGRDLLVITGEGGKALGKHLQRREIVGREDLALNDREVDLDLVEPAGMDGAVHEDELWIARLQPADRPLSPMRGAGIDNPEDTARIAIRRLRHDVVHEAVEGRNAVVRLAPAEELGAVDVQRSQIGPGTAALVLVFDPHGTPGSRRYSGVNPFARLDAGFLIGRDHEVVVR